MKYNIISSITLHEFFCITNNNNHVILLVVHKIYNTYIYKTLQICEIATLHQECYQVYI